MLQFYAQTDIFLSVLAALIHRKDYPINRGATYTFTSQLPLWLAEIGIC